MKDSHVLCIRLTLWKYLHEEVSTTHTRNIKNHESDLFKFLCVRRLAWNRCMGFFFLTLIWHFWHYWLDVKEVQVLTRSAPACSSTSATSVWPFSQAYVSAVSPVAVVACTLAPRTQERQKWMDQLWKFWKGGHFTVWMGGYGPLFLSCSVTLNGKAWCVKSGVYDELFMTNNHCLQSVAMLWSIRH